MATIMIDIVKDVQTERAPEVIGSINLPSRVKIRPGYLITNFDLTDSKFNYQDGDTYYIGLTVLSKQWLENFQCYFCKFTVEQVVVDD